MVVMMEQMQVANKELIAILKTSGTIELDWKTAKDQLDKNQVMLQDEIYKRFIKNPDDGLFFIFCRCLKRMKKLKLKLKKLGEERKKTL